MFVYICCAGGMTSSLICENIKKSAKSDLKIYLDALTNAASDFQLGKLNDFDIILGYGAASAITNMFIIENDLDKILDLVLISPQVRFELPRIKKIMNPYNVPVSTIEMRTFGTMNGSKMIEEILKYKS